MCVRKIFFISKLALILMLSVVIVTTVTSLRDPGEIFAPTSAASRESIGAVKTTNATKDSPENYSTIIERNIFSDVDSSLSANSSIWNNNAGGLVRSAEEELGLVLSGIICGSRQVSRAIIKDPKTNELGLYRQGDTVADACIETIEKDTVVLLHKGQRKVLNLSTTKSGLQDVYSAHPASVKTAKTNPIDTAVGAELITFGAKSGGGEGPLQKAVIEPYIVDGKVEGFRITGLEEKSIAKNLGLRNGDVIRSVNGHRLTNKQKAYQIFKKAGSQPSIDIELLRNNKTEKLSFSK